MFFSESASSKAQAELSNRDKATMLALYDLDEEVVQQSKNPKQTQVASTEPSEEISESGLSLSELAEDGKKAFLAQDYEESSKKFAECLKLSPDNLKIRIALGHSLNALADAKIQEKKANEAEQILRKCISLIEKTDQTDLLTTSLRKLRALMQENQQYDQVNQITLRLGQIESKSSQSQASN
jgi:tetratricopeptide (TPR) repeat protein